jgi:CRP-like cAMP-binding protein
MNAPRQPDLVLTNQLLAALPRAEYERLAPHLRKVKLIKNSILYDTGEDVHDAYFVQSGVVSLVSITEDGENVEAGIVGSEGMIGSPIQTVSLHRTLSVKT